MMLKLTTQCRQLLNDFERDNAIQILSIKVQNSFTITVRYIDGFALKQSNVCIQNNRITITDGKMINAQTTFLNVNKESKT